MSTELRDNIARLRAEARHFRDLANGKRRDIQAMKSQPIGQRNPIAILEAGLRRIEYTRSAQDRDRKISELRAQL